MADSKIFQLTRVESSFSIKPIHQNCNPSAERCQRNCLTILIQSSWEVYNIRTFKPLKKQQASFSPLAHRLRFGQPKQLLDWRGEPFVRVVAQTALEAGLSPVIVVITGANAEEVEAKIKDLPVIIVRNEKWQSGQSSSIRVGVKALPANAGSAIFLLSDQPQITADVIRALIEHHTTELYPIVAPLVMMEQRANPVLFDCTTFPDLLELEGDVGGRAIFSKYPVEYLPWHDDRLLLDVDKPEDYQRLIEDDTL